MRQTINGSSLPFILAALWLAAPVSAQSEQDLRNEIEALKRAQQELQRQLEKRAGSTGPEPSPKAAVEARSITGTELNLGENPIRGDATAPLTLIEIVDYQCPFCSRYLRETYPKIAAEYIAAGKLRYAVLDKPLEVHRLAFTAAEAGRCAGEQGKYWEMHDRLFANQRELDRWSMHAEVLGMDAAKLEECMKSGRHGDAIRLDMAEGKKVGAHGNPIFVLGSTDPENPKKVKGIAYLHGAQPYSAFEAAIDGALGELSD
jgi:protein-disulfide isomerase